MGRIRKFIQDPGNVVLALVSLVAVVNTFVFAGKEVESLGFMALFSLSSVYIIYALCFFTFLLAWMYILRNKVSFVVFLRKTLWVFLPTEIVFLFSLSQSIHFNYAFKLAVGAYIIALFIFLLFRNKGYENFSDFGRDFLDKDALNFKKDEDFKKKHPAVSKIPIVRNLFHWSVKEGVLASTVLILVMALNLGFGLYHLSKFAAVDEALWTDGRISKFWNNVSEREWEKTRVSDKPGITVAILSGIGLLQVDDVKYYQPIVWGGEVFSPPKSIEDFNFAFRFPILFFNFLMLPIFYILLKKLLGKETAVLGLILIGLSPLLLGISTIINPDSLLWVFVPLSMISYFIYLKKDGGNKYLYLAGIFAGLSLLTKYVANIIYVFFFGLIFLEYIINNARYRKSGASRYFKRAFLDYLIFIAFSLLVFYLLLPESWVRLSVLLEGTILSQAFEKVWPLFVAIIGLIFLDMFSTKNRITGAVLDWLSRFGKYLLMFSGVIFLIFVVLTLADTYLGMRFYDLESILASPKSSYAGNGFMGLMLANFYSLVFGISPVAFIGLLVVGARSLFSGKKVQENLLWAVYLMIFILIYYVASTVNHVSSTVRYQIILYPLALIISAIGIKELFELPKVKKYISFWAVSSVLVLVSVYSLDSIRPFYFSYASSLLPKEYVLNLKDMGDGSYEAAEYLNSLPDAKKLIVWSDKRGVCNFFVGRCKSGTKIDKEDDIFDYFVVSSGRESRTSKIVFSSVNSGNNSIIRLDKLYENEEADFKLEIGGRPNNFVKVISKEKAFKD